MKHDAGYLSGEFKTKDWLNAIVFDKFGNVKQSHFGEDLITSAGKAAVAGLLTKDVAISGFEYIAIGSGNTAASTGDTALDAEFKRAGATGSRVTTTVSNDTAQFVYVFASGKPAGLNGTSTGTRAIEESAIFNSPTAGQLQMLCRQTFGALNVDWDGGDSLQLTWKVQAT